MRWLLALCLLASCHMAVDRGFAPGWVPHQGPERVCMADSELSPDFDESLDVAVDLWNSAAGCRMIEVTCHDPTVAVVSVPYARGWSMRMLPGQIQVARAVDTYQVALELTHELGHVLGLAHDDYGIMAPLSPWEPWVEVMDQWTGTRTVMPPPWIPRITDGDRRRVRRLCR